MSTFHKSYKHIFQCITVLDNGGNCVFYQKLAAVDYPAVSHIFSTSDSRCEFRKIVIP